MQIIPHIALHVIMEMKETSQQKMEFPHFTFVQANILPAEKWRRRRGSKPNQGLSSSCVNVRRDRMNKGDDALFFSDRQEGVSRTKTHQNAHRV
jgi:hypothetical protein